MVVKDRLNHIVDKSFPELLSFTFSLEYDELDDSFAETWETSKTSYTFTLDNLFKTADEETVIGLLAHELAHITQDKGQSMFERWIDSFLCDHFPRYSLLDERDADLTVILRGYGLNLLKLLRFIDKKYPEYVTEGLSINELEIILNLI
jgi:hypothetical protein